MACSKCGGSCKKNKCIQLSPCDANAISDALAAEFNQNRNGGTGGLSKGHPMIMLWENSDILAFDVKTGWGSGIWDGWAMANGNTYKGLQTPNMMGKLPFGADLAHPLNTSGGALSISPTVAQLPVHTPSIAAVLTNPTINDPQHGHGVTDPGHNHTAGSSTITPTGTVQPTPNHVHHIFGNDGNNGGGGNSSVSKTNANGTTFQVNDTEAAGAFNPSLTMDPFTVSVSVSSNHTGISVQPNSTGITLNTNGSVAVTAQPIGEGKAIDITPPYYALLYVTKIF